MTDEPGRFDHWGGGLHSHLPERRQQLWKGRFRARRHRHPPLLPLCRRIRCGSRSARAISSASRVASTQADARLACRGKTGASDRDPYAVSHVGWGLNPQCRWDSLRPLRRCARAQPRRGAQLSRATSCSRPARTRRAVASARRGPLRRADARLHHLARRPHRGRERARRRCTDASRAASPAEPRAGIRSCSAGDARDLHLCIDDAPVLDHGAAVDEMVQPRIGTS